MSESNPQENYERNVLYPYLELQLRITNYGDIDELGRMVDRFGNQEKTLQYVLRWIDVHYEPTKDNNIVSVFTLLVSKLQHDSECLNLINSINEVRPYRNVEFENCKNELIKIVEDRISILNLNIPTFKGGRRTHVRMRRSRYVRRKNNKRRRRFSRRQKS